MEKYKTTTNLKEKTFIFRENEGLDKLCSEKDMIIEKFKKEHKCKASIINAIQDKYGFLIIIETVFYEE